MTDPRTAIVQEFGNYYFADEIESILYGDSLDQWVDGSVYRLATKLGDNRSQAAVALREAAEDRTGAFVAALEEASLFGWTGTDEDWVLFQYVVRRIASGLDATNGNTETRT